MLRIWLFSCGVTAAILEIVIGSTGLAVPLFVCTAFYFSVLAGWRVAVPLLAAPAILIDLAACRPFPATLPALFATAFLASPWRQHGDCRVPLIQALPGAATGALGAGSLIVLSRLSGSTLSAASLWNHVGFLVRMTGTGAVLLPGICLVLDRIAPELALPRYDSVRDRPLGATDL